MRGTAAVWIALLVSLSASAREAQVILPIGDSITEGFRDQCSYRKPLTQDLQANASCSVAFVGPRRGNFTQNDFCNATATNHAGYSGWRADQFTTSLIAGYMSDYNPDYVLIHLGSNDIHQGESVSSTVNDIDRIISDVLTDQPSATVLLANMIPWNPSVFNNGNVDEEARSIELTAALTSLAAQRSAGGDAVILVDVASGFDSATLTYDGVHPNEAGEDFLAQRFSSALEVAGLCATEPELPVLTLNQNEWRQISLPANAGSLNTVGEIFDELPVLGYDQSWVVHGIDRSLPTFGYAKMGLGTRMNQGEAYWVLQTAQSRVDVRLPAGTTRTPLQVSPACPSEAGCFSVPLLSQSGTVRWNMVGYPHDTPGSLAGSRAVTGTGTCVDGCALDDADNNVMHHTLFVYDSTQASGYREITGSDTMQPWDGAWSAVLEGANGNRAEWLVPRE